MDLVVLINTQWAEANWDLGGEVGGIMNASTGPLMSSHFDTYTVSHLFKFSMIGRNFTENPMAFDCVMSMYGKIYTGQVSEGKFTESVE